VYVLLILGPLFFAAASVILGAAVQQEPIVPIPLTAKADPTAEADPIAAEANADPKRAAIGERLFGDVRVSQRYAFSCATCHPLDRGGMDGRKVSSDNGGTRFPRNTPTIFNVSLNATFNWDGSANTLEEQADRTVSRVMKIAWPELIARLRSDPAYASAFSSAYPDGLTRPNVLDAIASFERSLVTPNSRFDRYLSGDRRALTAREQEGYRLFKSHGCASCHQGVNVGGNLYERLGVFGAGPPGGSHAGSHTGSHLGSAREEDPGRFLITGAPRDKHVFRVPSLRNVALTAPYFHDGDARTLADAVDVMGKAQLGRKLPADDIGLIVEFLRTLTGEYRGQPLTAPMTAPRSEAP
jgi:cytochrome c peroxidase